MLLVPIEKPFEMSICYHRVSVRLWNSIPSSTRIRSKFKENTKNSILSMLQNVEPLFWDRVSYRVSLFIFCLRGVTFFVQSHITFLKHSTKFVLPNLKINYFFIDFYLVIIYYSHVLFSHLFLYMFNPI